MAHHKTRWKGWRGLEDSSGSFLSDGKGGWLPLTWEDRQRLEKGLPLRDPALRPPPVTLAPRPKRALNSRVRRQLDRGL